MKEYIRVVDSMRTSLRGVGKQKEKGKERESNGEEQKIGKVRDIPVNYCLCKCSKGENLG